MTISGKSWTTNQWTEYYFRQNGSEFLILSSTSDTLTVSDPNGYLTDGTLTAQICKFFKIRFNDTTNAGTSVLTLVDDDNELVSGSYSYLIDFIKCKVKQETFAGQQAVFAYLKWQTKADHAITFEEVD